MHRLKDRRKVQQRVVPDPHRRHVFRAAHSSAAPPSCRAATRLAAAAPAAVRLRRGWAAPIPVAGAHLSQAAAEVHPTRSSDICLATPRADVGILGTAASYFRTTSVHLASTLSQRRLRRGCSRRDRDHAWIIRWLARTTWNGRARHGRGSAERFVLSGAIARIPARSSDRASAGDGARDEFHDLRIADQRIVSDANQRNVVRARQFAARLRRHHAVVA
jgi:hypothetical protein